MYTLIVVIFVLGYAAIAFEHPLRINKTAPALLIGVLCWTVYVLGFHLTTEDQAHLDKCTTEVRAMSEAYSHVINEEIKACASGGSEDLIRYTEHVDEHFIKANEHVVEQLSSPPHMFSAQLLEHLGEIASILFFLIGAMTIVELIDVHNGFEVITSMIKTTDKRKLMWIICLLTFFLSAALDNLTTSIVMVSLLRKIVDKREDRLMFAGMVVIAANSGGAWSPIGDVTTTMLWIGGQITAMNIIIKVILPSLVSLLVPLIAVSFVFRGNVTTPELAGQGEKAANIFERNLVFFVGVGALVFVPVFKTITHLPPYMGMMLGLGILWTLTELLHKNKKDKFKSQLSVSHALERIDIPSVLFFLGILLAISALQATGQLAAMAVWLDETVRNNDIIITLIGLLSAIVDNVPLVAAAQGMYAMDMYPQDAQLWEFLAYCAGTGGSVLIIGSAAGVAVMGIERIDFIWYLKKISWLALIGYFAGVGTYLLMV